MNQHPIRFWPDVKCRRAERARGDLNPSSVRRRAKHISLRVHSIVHSMMLSSAPSTPLELVDHLISQNAVRAAARLSNYGNVTPPPVCDGYAVPSDRVILIDSAESAAEFAAALHDLLQSQDTIGIDVEWQPDAPQTSAQNRPSLLQLATVTRVWLLDLEAPACCDQELLSTVASLLASNEHRVLGYGVQVDIDRLQLLYRHPQLSPLTARRVVDLRDACLSAATLPCETGLAAQLRAWTGKSLDKAMQCSDWAARPLSAAQVAYAAADAMSLHELDRAIGRSAIHSGVDSLRREVTLTARRAADRKRSARARVTDDEEAEQVDEDEAQRRCAAGVDGLALVRSAIASLPLAHVADCWLADPSTIEEFVEPWGGASGPTEINALCFTGGPQYGDVLVLVPARAPKVDVRWLALALDWPKRKLRLATDDECVEAFGAVPGRVPPLPLRAGVNVLCDPRLRDATELWGSSGDARLRLFMRKPRFTMPALVAAAAVAAAASAEGAPRASPSTFSWLPSPSKWFATLDDALDALSAMGASTALPSARCDARLPHRSSKSQRCADDVGGCQEAHADGFSWDLAEAAAAAAAAATAADEGRGPPVWRPSAEVKLIVDPALSVLARKLRMFGVDCLVAGEVLRTQPPGEPGDVDARGATRRARVGLLRVFVDGSVVGAHLRLAALEGRLLVTTARHAKQPTPCATYRLLATEDATKQLAEVLTVLQLSEAAHHATGSRCGICNGDAWHKVRPSEVEEGQVPKAVLRKQPVFYRCGVCSQIFWPSGAHPADVGAEIAEWRPSSQIVMALGAKAKHGQMMREARGLHSTLKMQFEGSRAVLGATYLY